MNVVVLETVDFLEVTSPLSDDGLVGRAGLVEGGLASNMVREAYVQVFSSPLCFLNQIKGGVNDELVHVFCLVPKSCKAISAHFGRAKVQLKEGIVAGADDGEVVRHVVAMAAILASAVRSPQYGSSGRKKWRWCCCGGCISRHVHVVFKTLV